MDETEKRTRFEKTIEYLFVFVATIFATYPIFYDLNDPAKKDIAFPAFFETIIFGFILVYVITYVKQYIGNKS